LAGAGAAATSSVVGGQLGVAGTVVGAGIASIITGLAVTIYGRSLDKGKEKIKEVGSKLAPAVKAQMAKGGPGAKTGTAQGVRRPRIHGGPNGRCRCRMDDRLRVGVVRLLVTQAAVQERALPVRVRRGALRDGTRGRGLCRVRRRGRHRPGHTPDLTRGVRE